MFYFPAGVGYVLAVMFAVGCIISSIMFFVYLKKGIKAKREIALEAQESEALQSDAPIEEAEEAHEEEAQEQ